MHSSPPQASLPAQVLAPKSYPDDCRWTFEKEKGGYPLVAFEGDMGAYVCPSTFRDLSDYVFGWPYSHFGENVHVMDNNQVPQHLPPVSRCLMCICRHAHVTIRRHKAMVYTV